MLCASGTESIPRAPCCPFTCATHRTGTGHWSKPRALLCSQQAGSWGWNAFTPCCRHGALSTAQHTYTVLLQSALVFFMVAGVKITVIAALGCLKRPLALWWSYCKAALLVNSNYKLIQQYECGCKQVLQLLKYLFMSKIVLDKMHTR